MFRRAAALAAIIAVASIAGQDLTAQLLSSRPITIIIPFTPGASSDTLQRLVAKKVTENTGQVLVVESRPGGSGSIGAMAVKMIDQGAEAAPANTPAEFAAFIAAETEKFGKVVRTVGVKGE